MGDRGYYTGRGKGASSPIFPMDRTAPRIILIERGLGYVFALPVEPPRGGSPSDQQPRRRLAFHGRRDLLHS